MSAPEAIALDLGHLTIHALTWGPPDGRLVLCLHGFPDSAWGWRRFGPLLAEHGYRVVAPFSRGYAPTGPAPDGDYHVGALMYDVIELHRRLGAPRDAVVIGHDWGAFTSNGLAAYPQSPFSQHISISVPPIGAMTADPHTIVRQIAGLPVQLRRSWYVVFFQLPVLPERQLPRVIPRLWSDWGPRETDTSAELAAALAALPTPRHRRAAVSFYRTLVRPGTLTPGYAELQRWCFRLPTHPMLYIHGDHDGAIGAASAKTLPTLLSAGSSVHILSGAGHFVQVDQPEALSALVLSHLQSAQPAHRREEPTS